MRRHSIHRRHLFGTPNELSGADRQCYRIRKIPADFASDLLNVYTLDGVDPLIEMLENYLQERLEFPWPEIPHILDDIEQHADRKIDENAQRKKLQNMDPETAYRIANSWAYHADADITDLEDAIESFLGEPCVIPWNEILTILEPKATAYTGTSPKVKQKEYIGKPFEKKFVINNTAKPSNKDDDRLDRMQDQINQLTAAVNKLCEVLMKEKEHG